MTLNPEKFRKDFPLLARDGKDEIIYLDNACMTLRPQQVIDKITEYYKEYPACAGRSVHALSRRVDEEVHKARVEVQKFIGAKKSEEIIFLRNTTEGINLVAHAFPFQKGDVIITSDKEHNSNLLPWQIIAQEKGLKHVICHSNEDNTFSHENYQILLDKYKAKVALVALGHTSNLDGVTIPAQEIIKCAHKAGAKVLLDAAQSIPHQEVDVKKLDVDFLAFSGHKACGPSGTGVLYGKKELLEQLHHFNVGGETVFDSTHDAKGNEWEGIPHKFEAGLQNYAGIVGLGEALRYLKRVGLKEIHKHEIALNTIITDGLKDIEGLSIIGPKDPGQRGGIFSFIVDKVSTHDLAGMIDSSSGIAVRSGAHCVHSWFNAHKLDGSVRASVYFYNTESEAKAFVQAVKDALSVLK